MERYEMMIVNWLRAGHVVEFRASAVYFGSNPAPMGIALRASSAAGHIDEFIPNLYRNGISPAAEAWNLFPVRGFTPPD
jgi:hypothetical protein